MLDKTLWELRGLLMLLITIYYNSGVMITTVTTSVKLPLTVRAHGYWVVLNKLKTLTIVCFSQKSVCQLIASSI